MEFEPTKRMQWQQLYSAQRKGSSSSKPISAEQTRTSFIRDYDRLIFSSAFRRLQNKTQVFPLPGSVFVHNRLTHSLEVASVGRSLGKAAGIFIAECEQSEEEVFNEFYRNELANVIAAGCLAHDIGNPPFGHSGEDAIRTYFNNLQGQAKHRFDNELSEPEKADFIFFEGNANAFRTLTHSFGENLQGGFRLTYATLASIVKYPCSSIAGFNKAHLFTKKCGFFTSEIATWQELAATLGIPQIGNQQIVYARHPFVYLVEAADDICYRVIDFEDAHRLGIISLSTLEGLFLAFFDKEDGYYLRTSVEKKLYEIRDANQKVQFLRATLIGQLVQLVTRIFAQQHNTLLQGTLSLPLMDLLPAHELKLMAAIDDFSIQHIYNHRSVVEVELAGYHVIGALLDMFVTALIQPKTPKSLKLLNLIPAQFDINTTQATFYNNLQSVVDFVAGMTDLYAVELFRKITGIEVARMQ